MDRKTRKASVDAISRWVSRYGRLSLLVSLYNPEVIPSELEWFYVHTAKINAQSIEFYGSHGTSVELSGYQFSILPQYLHTVKWIMRDYAQQKRRAEILDMPDAEVEQGAAFSSSQR